MCGNKLDSQRDASDLPSDKMNQAGRSSIQTRTMSYDAAITRNPAICHGKPTIRGLRYPVELILDLLGAGMSPRAILDDFPDLEPDDVPAVLEYAAHSERSALRPGG